MAKTVTSITLGRSVMTVPYTDPAGCVPADGSCPPCGSGSCGPATCVDAPTLCNSGNRQISASWTIVRDGVTITLCHSLNSGGVDVWTSQGGQWQMKYDPVLNEWTVTDLVTGDVWVQPPGNFDCTGINVFAPEDGVTVDTIIATNVYDCTSVGYNCVSGLCCEVPAAGATYATLADCVAACGSGSGSGSGSGGGVLTDCCPMNLIPTSFPVVMSGALAALGTVTVTWTGASWQSGDITQCGVTSKLVVLCASGTMTITFGTTWNALATIVSCSPLRITASGFTTSMVCSGTATADVTL